MHFISQIPAATSSVRKCVKLENAECLQVDWYDLSRAALEPLPRLCSLGHICTSGSPQQYILSKIYVKKGLFGRDQEMLPLERGGI